MHGGGRRPGHRFQVVARGAQLAVLGDHLHRILVRVGQVELVERDVERHLRCDVLGGDLGAQIGLAGEVRPQDEQEGDPRGDQRDSDDDRRAQRRPGPYGAEDAPHPATSR